MPSAGAKKAEQQRRRRQAQAEAMPKPKAQAATSQGVSIMCGNLDAATAASPEERWAASRNARKRERRKQKQAAQTQEGASHPWQAMARDPVGWEEFQQRLIAAAREDDTVSESSESSKDSDDAELLAEHPSCRQ